MASNRKSSITKASEISLAKELIAGIGKHYTNVALVTFAGQSLAPAQVASTLQTFVSLLTDTETAKVAATAKLAAENAQAPPLRTFMDAFVTVVKATWGTQPDVLADFGLPPKKARTPLTVEQKAAAAAKREATREARGTKGAVQKAAVKGNVTGVVITPVTATPATPTPTAAPAPIVTGPSGAATGGSTTH